MGYQYIFGPVPSRRLGSSLGVDIVPFKTCSMDCVYCECGATTCLTLERKEYIPVNDILKELDGFLSTRPELNYITFSGGGEPTLNSGIGRIISHLKSHYPHYKICLLTNSTFLGDRALIEELKNIDLIVPSLDASTEEEFTAINKPPPSLKLSDIINNLLNFRKHSSALFWLELFIVPGVNDSDESIKRFVKIIKEIKPDKVQLTSLDRPGTENWVKSVSHESANLFLEAIKPHAEVEIIAKFKYANNASSEKNVSDNLEDKIMKLISRRPFTVEDILFALPLNRALIESALASLEKNGRISTEKKDRGTFYRPKI